MRAVEEPHLTLPSLSIQVRGERVPCSSFPHPSLSGEAGSAKLAAPPPLCQCTGEAPPNLWIPHPTRRDGEGNQQIRRPTLGGSGV